MKSHRTLVFAACGSADRRERRKEITSRRMIAILGMYPTVRSTYILYGIGLKDEIPLLQGRRLASRTLDGLDLSIVPVPLREDPVEGKWPYDDTLTGCRPRYHSITVSSSIVAGATADLHLHVFSSRVLMAAGSWQDNSSCTVHTLWAEYGYGIKQPPNKLLRPCHAWDPGSSSLGNTSTFDHLRDNFTIASSNMCRRSVSAHRCRPMQTDARIIDAWVKLQKVPSLR